MHSKRTKDKKKTSLDGAHSYLIFSLLTQSCLYIYRRGRIRARCVLLCFCCLSGGEFHWAGIKARDNSARRENEQTYPQSKRQSLRRPGNAVGGAEWLLLRLSQICSLPASLPVSLFAWCRSVRAALTRLGPPRWPYGRPLPDPRPPQRARPPSPWPCTRGTPCAVSTYLS
jgi:hypothetical protein